MNCQDMENMLPAYLEDLLSADEKKLVAEHLAACPQCSKALADLKKAESLVHELKEVEPPPWFKQRIMAQVRAEAGKKSFMQKWFYPLRIKIPVQIVATIVITVLAVYIYRTGEQEMKAVLPRTAAPVIETQKEAQQAPAEAFKPPLVSPKVQTEEPKAQRDAQRNQNEAPKIEEYAPPPRHSIKKKASAHSGGGSDEKSAVYDVSPGAGAASALKAEEKSVRENKAVNADSAAKREVAKDKADSEKQAGLAVRQEAPAKAMPASPAMEPAYVPEVSDLSTKKQYRAAAPMAAQSMGAAARQGQTIISLNVADIKAAVPDVEKILIKFNAQNIVKRSSAEKSTIIANLRTQDVRNFIAQLKTVGKIEEKSTSTDNFEQYTAVVIEILNN
jgi:hypothetical protein